MTGASPSGRAGRASPEPFGLGHSATIPDAGPWTTTEYGYEKHAIADGRGTEIGFAHRRRDAHLIAAAPELYAALERIAAGVDGASAGKIARAAIAKARGEQTVAVVS